MTEFWRTGLKVVAFAIGGPAILFGLLMLWIIGSEWDSRYRGRIYVTRADMKNIALAIEEYRKRYGRLPISLEERAPNNVTDDRQFLPRVFSSAWGTPYVFEIVKEKSGERIRIWTTPDPEGRKRCHRDQLSSDWFASDDGPWRECLR